MNENAAHSEELKGKCVPIHAMKAVSPPFLDLGIRQR